METKVTTFYTMGDGKITLKNGRRDRDMATAGTPPSAQGPAEVGLGYY